MQLGDEIIIERVGVNKCELSELSKWLRNKACLQQPVKLPLIVYYTTSVQVKILQGTNSSRTKSAMRGKSQSTEPGVHQKQHHLGTITCLETTNV